MIPTGDQHTEVIDVLEDPAGEWVEIGRYRVPEYARMVSASETAALRGQLRMFDGVVRVRRFAAEFYTGDPIAGELFACDWTVPAGQTVEPSRLAALMAKAAGRA